jgi:hypothetical protein
MIQRLFRRFMGSIASIELYVKNTKLFRRRGVMSPFQWRDITNEALPDWYHRLDNKALCTRQMREKERQTTTVHKSRNLKLT